MRVRINFSKFHSFLQDFTHFSVARMPTMVGPDGKFLKFGMHSEKCFFQCKLRYLARVTLQGDFRMKNVFRMRNT